LIPGGADQVNFLALVVSGALLLAGLSSFAGPVGEPEPPAAVVAVATHAGGLLMIPEPGTASLLALGLFGLIIVGRRRPR
jgi:hypothetical protein